MGKHLTEQQFNTITAQLRKKSNDVATVAEASGLKVSTIKAIRRATTWQNYQAGRKAQGEKIKALQMLDKIAKANQTQAQPLIRDIKPVVKKTTVLERVEKLLKERNRIMLEIAQLTARFDKLEAAFNDLQADDIVSDLKQRRTFLARLLRGQR